MLDLMRRYVYGFVNSHDPTVAQEIMDPAYRLHMGTDTLIGRDDAYLPAVMHQMGQFPDLEMTVHDLVTDGARTALYFSEHGRSSKDPDCCASWPGVSIYRAQAHRLQECWVEQDHFGRRRQLAAGRPDAPPPVAIAPWSRHSAVPPEARTRGRAALEAWLDDLTSWPPPAAEVDPGSASKTQPRISVESSAVNALVVEGDRVAFNISLTGVYQGGLPGSEETGVGVETYVGAFADVADGTLTDVRAVTNRVAVRRQLHVHSEEMPV